MEGPAGKTQCGRESPSLFEKEIEKEIEKNRGRIQGKMQRSFMVLSHNTVQKGKKVPKNSRKSFVA
jgi:hypothetical protein